MSVSSRPPAASQARIGADSPLPGQLRVRQGGGKGRPGARRPRPARPRPRPGRRMPPASAFQTRERLPVAQSTAPLASRSSKRHRRLPPCSGPQAPANNNATNRSRRNWRRWSRPSPACRTTSGGCRRSWCRSTRTCRTGRSSSWPGHFDIADRADPDADRRGQEDGQVGQGPGQLLHQPSRRRPPRSSTATRTQMVEGKTARRHGRACCTRRSAETVEPRPGRSRPHLVGAGYFAPMQRWLSSRPSRVVEAVVHGLDLAPRRWAGRAWPRRRGSPMTAAILDDLLARRTVPGRPPELSDDLERILAASGRGGLRRQQARWRLQRLMRLAGRGSARRGAGRWRRSRRACRVRSRATASRTPCRAGRPARWRRVSG